MPNPFDIQDTTAQTDPNEQFFQSLRMERLAQSALDPVSKEEMWALAKEPREIPQLISFPEPFAVPMTFRPAVSEDMERGIHEGFYNTSYGLAYQMARGPVERKPPEGLLAKSISQLISFGADPVTYLSGGAANVLVKSLAKRYAGKMGVQAAFRLGERAAFRGIGLGATLGGIEAVKYPMGTLAYEGRFPGPFEYPFQVGKSAALGAVAGAVGAPKYVGFPAEVLAFGTFGPLLELRLPKLGDYAESAIVLGTLRAVNMPKALWKESRGRKLTPEEDRALNLLTAEERMAIEIEARKPRIPFSWKNSDRPFERVLKFEKATTKEQAGKVLDELIRRWEQRGKERAEGPFARGLYRAAEFVRGEKAPTEVVVRYETPGEKPGTTEKPQGLYVTPSDVPSIHKETLSKFEKVKPRRTVWGWKPKKPLKVEGDLKLEHERFRGAGDKGYVSAGIKALKKLLAPEKFERLMRATKRELNEEFSKEYPKVEWTRYYDAYEMLEGYAGLKAREAGYDAIVEPYSLADPGSTEYIALTSDVLKPVREREVLFPRETRDKILEEFDPAEGFLRVPDHLASTQAVVRALDTVFPRMTMSERRGPESLRTVVYEPMKESRKEQARKEVEKIVSLLGEGKTGEAREAFGNIISFLRRELTPQPKTLGMASDPWSAAPVADPRIKSLLAFLRDEVAPQVGMEGMTGIPNDIILGISPPEGLSPVGGQLVPTPGGELAPLGGELVAWRPPPEHPRGRYAVTPDPIKGEKPKKSWDIIFDVYKALGKRIPYTRKKTMTGAQAEYIPSVSAVVLRYAGDVSNAAKGIAAALDDAYGILKPWDRPGTKSPYDAELLDFSYRADIGGPWWHQLFGHKGSREYQRHQGMMVWLADYVVNPTEAVKRAPEFSRYFFEKIGEAAKKELDAFSHDVRVHLGARPHERMVSNVLTEDAYPAIQNYWQSLRGLLHGIPDRKGRPIEVNPVDKMKRLVDDELAVLFKLYDAGRSLQGLDAPLPSKDLRTLANVVHGYQRKLWEFWEGGAYTFDGRDVYDPGYGKDAVTVPRADLLERAIIPFGKEPTDLAPGQRAKMTWDWLFEPYQTGNKERFVENRHLGVSYLLAERHVEKTLEWGRAAVEMINETNRIGNLRMRLRTERRPEHRRSINEAIREAKARVKHGRETLGFKGNVTNKRVKDFYVNKVNKALGTGIGITSDFVISAETILDLAADPARMSMVQEGARRYRMLADHMLKYAVDAELITPEMYRNIRSKNEYYASWKRVMKPIDPEMLATHDKFAGKTKVGSWKFRRVRGSTAPLVDPYISLAMQISSIMKQGDLNAAKRAFTDLLEVRTKYQAPFHDVSELGRPAPDKGKPEDPIISVYKKGVERFYEIHPDVYDGLNRLSLILPDKKAVWTVLNSMARLTRASVTKFPAFAQRQILAREPLSVMILSDSDVKPWNFFWWPEGSPFSKTLREYYKAGGGQFGFMGVSERNYYRLLRDAVNRAGSRPDTLLTTPYQIWKKYNELLSWGETFPRVVEYREAYKKGREMGYNELDARLHAMNKARGIQDFARLGTLLRELNEVIPFSGPAYRGLMRGVEAMVDHPWRTSTKIFTYVGLMKMAEILLNHYRGDLNELRQKESYLRDMFFNVKLGPDWWLRIALPWELGVLGSFYGRSLDYILMKSGVTPEDPYAVEKKSVLGYGPEFIPMFSGWLESLASSASPFEIGDIFGAMQPIAEALVNKAFFKRTYPVPPWEADKELELRDNVDKASRLGNLLQGIFHVDARKFDHVISGMLGDTGRFALALSDIGRPTRAGLERAEKTLFGFFSTSPAYGSRDVQWIFDFARRKDLMSTPQIRRLRQSLDKYNYARTNEERDAAAQELHKVASRVRAQLLKREPSKTRRRLRQIERREKKRRERALGQERNPFG